MTLPFDPQDILQSEVIEHSQPTNERSASRRVALQVLYEVDSASHPLSEVLKNHLTYHQFASDIQSYLHQVVYGVMRYRVGLDNVIQLFAPEWPLSQVAVVDRNILRLALYEFLMLENMAKTPAKVAIDEAVELAKLFGAENSSKFVNGVLGSAMDDLAKVEEMLNQHREERDQSS